MRHMFHLPTNDPNRPMCEQQMLPGDVVRMTDTNVDCQECLKALGHTLAGAKEVRAQDLFGIDPGFARNYNADVHKDCTECPESVGKKCDKIGTGIHQLVAVHLELVHGWSLDKIEGIRLGGMLSGKGDLEVLNLAHEGILLFQPAKPTVGYGPEFDIDKRGRHA